MASIFDKVINKVGDEQIRLLYDDDFSFELHKTFSTWVENKIIAYQFIKTKMEQRYDGYSRPASYFLHQFAKHLHEQLCVNGTCNYSGQSITDYRNTIDAFIQKIPYVSKYFY